MSKKLIMILAAIFLVGTIGLAGCGEEAAEGEPTEGEEEEETIEEIDMAYVNWACSIAQSHVAEEIIETELGYDVELTMADPGPIYSDIANGDTDAYVSAWLPTTQGSYMEEYGDELVDLGPVYEGARVGLVVPEYVEVDDIEDMADYADEFEGSITGIDPGAGVMEATGDALDTYDSLADFSLMESSGPAMTASLDEAASNEEWIVVTGWTPHWKFASYDLKFLDDPENVYGDAETINALVREGLSEDAEDVQNFFDNYKMEDEVIGEVMAMIDESDDPEASAEQWVEENQDKVQEWLD